MEMPVVRPHPRHSESETLARPSNLCLFFFFLAVPDLHCCVRAFSSWGERGLLITVVHGLLIVVASILPEHRLYTHGLEQLWCTGLVVPWPVVSSWTRDRAHVLHIDRWVLNHWTPGKSSAILLTIARAAFSIQQ